MKTYDIKKFQESNVFKALVTSFNPFPSFFPYHLATQMVNVKEVLDFGNSEVLILELSNGLPISEEFHVHGDIITTNYKYHYDSEGNLMEVTINSPLETIPTSIKFTDYGLDVIDKHGIVKWGIIYENLTVTFDYETFTEVEGGVRFTSPINTLTLQGNSAYDDVLPTLGTVTSVSWKVVEGGYQVTTVMGDEVTTQFVKIISSESR